MMRKLFFIAALLLLGGKPLFAVIVVGNYTIQEGASPNAVNVTMYDNFDRPGPFIVTFETTDGTATGSDYNPVLANRNWPVGLASWTVPVTINDDLLVEGDETINLTVTTRDGLGNKLFESKATITILDNDVSTPPTFSFSPAIYNVTEGAGPVVVSVIRSGDISQDSTVLVKTKDGTALDGQDYTGFTQTLHWASGDTNAILIPVPIIDDLNFEAPETLTLNLIDPQSGTVLPNTATISIIDNDTVSPISGRIAVNLSSTNTFQENGGPVVIKFERVGGTHGELNLRYETMNGTALAGFDFTQESGFIKFGDGDSIPKTLSIPILNDNVAETDETFNVVLTWMDGPTAGEVVTWTVVIKDEDPPSAQSAGPLQPSKNLVDLSKNEQAEIQTHLESSGNLEIKIYDRLGRKINDFLNVDRPAGDYRDTWNCRDSEGAFVAAGVYHALIKEGGKTRKLSIIILK